jgi:hypothetical protein
MVLTKINLDELLLYECPVPVIVEGGEYLLSSLRGLLLSVPLKQEVRGLGVHIGSSSTFT